MPMPMPYPYYPAPQMYFSQQTWPMNPHPVPSTSHPVGFHQNPSSQSKLVKGPTISAWLEYCNNYPDHSGDNLAALATNFDAQGYWTIDQLTSGRISIKNLSSWMNIGKGTADYIIQYADEDMVLTNDGKLTMADLPNVDNSDDGSL